MWVLIIIGLIMLFIYSPIGIGLIILGLIVWAFKKRKEGMQVKGFGLQTEMKKCPMCAEEIKSEALICRFCGHKFPEPKGLSERISCSDGSCVGVIDEEGVCNICGKPLKGEEKR